MENVVPQFLIEKLNKQYGEEIIKNILNGYSQNRIVSLRVNTIKSNVQDICSELLKNSIEFEKISFCNEAVVIKNANEEIIKELDIYKNGSIYLQSLSSMLPPIILNPKENEDILDMTAAPGGKTTQIAALTNNKAHITACEINNIRIEKLKYNVDKQGATCVSILKEDSRKLNDYFAFDKILLDAPCTGSGTIELTNEKTYNGFTEKLLNKTTQSQLTLLKKALKILKPGHEMVYSTCSILQEENEDIINKVIKEGNAKVIPIEIQGDIPQLPCKIKGALCVAPTKYYEGFFVVKLKKIK